MSRKLKQIAPKQSTTSRSKPRKLTIVPPPNEAQEEMPPVPPEQLLDQVSQIEGASDSANDLLPSPMEDDLDSQLEEAIHTERDDDLPACIDQTAAEPEAASSLPDARLMVHAGASKITRPELANLPVAEATATFQPIPHARLIDQLEEALAFRHISIVRDDYAVSPDGMRLFALLELNADCFGVRFAIGLRNANDRSMRLGMVAGYRVFVCDNMALSGDFKPLLAKHSKHFDLVDSLSIGVDRIQRNFEPLKASIQFMQERDLSDDQARLIIYKAFLEQKFPRNLMKLVHTGYFEPQHEEFKRRTIWSLSNAFTTTFKQLVPVRQYELTARLGKYLQPYAVAG
ncbi:MAG: DUF932 domain-containing protein [Pyrinomonadaceae bacterium]